MRPRSKDSSIWIRAYSLGFRVYSFPGRKARACAEGIQVGALISLIFSTRWWWGILQHNSLSLYIYMYRYKYAYVYRDHYKWKLTARSQYIQQARRGEAPEVEIQQRKAEHYQGRSIFHTMPLWNFRRGKPAQLIREATQEQYTKDNHHHVAEEVRQRGMEQIPNLLLSQPSSWLG